VGSLVNTQKTFLKTMVNADVDGYSKTLNYRKKLLKTQ